MAQEIDDVLFKVDSTTFEEDDWNAVVYECSSLASKWQLLSTFLGLNASVIDQIKCNFPNDCVGCWSEALKQWIKGNYNTQKYGEPSWKTLLKAIAMVDELHFKRLASKYQNKSLYLVDAAQNGDMQQVRLLTEEQHANPLQKISELGGSTALHYAAGFGHLDVLKYFVEERGCNPAIQDDQGMTPLHYAAQMQDNCKHLDIVCYLVAKQQMDPLCCANNGTTPLHAACHGGDIDIVQFLVNEIRKSLPLKDILISRGRDGRAPINFAAQNGHLEIVKYFITELNCDPNIVAPAKYQGRTNVGGGRIALHDAAQEGHLHIVKYLVEQCNCNPSHLDNMRVTPLYMAAQQGYLEVVRYLTLEQHCEPMCTDEEKNTPLHRAAAFGRLEVVKFFIEVLHCPLDVRGRYNLTPLEYARGQGRHHVVQYLESIYPKPK